jgi:glutathione S-transferase
MRDFPMLKIYDFKGFPNPARVRIAIAEKGLIDRVTFVTVDVPAGEHKKPAFLAKNPAGAVPVLELEDGTCISECTAITEYLDNIDGEPVLTGRNARERALIHMMQRRAEAGLLDAVAAYFHHATPGLGPHIETYQNREWGEKNRERALAGMHYLDGVLAAQHYLAGERFSMADITAFAGLAFADFAKIEMPADLTNLKSWRGRIAERPSVAHA